MDQPSNREDAINRLSSRILAWFSKPANVILFAFLCVFFYRKEEDFEFLRRRR